MGTIVEFQLLALDSLKYSNKAIYTYMTNMVLKSYRNKMGLIYMHS